MALSNLQQLREQIASNGYDALAAIPGPNLQHITGVDFHLSERPIVALFRDSDQLIVVPQLEEAKAQSGTIDFEVFTYDDTEGPKKAFATACAHFQLDHCRLGVEGRRMRYLELALLPAAEVENADPAFAHLRLRKDAAALDRMRRAVEIAETAFHATVAQLQPGITEQELAAELVLQTLRAGSSPELPFSPIVATGANGSLPHASAGARALSPGDLVTIDWGASHQHYFSDITRTIGVAGATVRDELQAAYEAVAGANEAGRNAVRPGATAASIDQAARAVIEEAGLGQYFTHRTGHGLGLECHEEPDIKDGSSLVLEEGMTFTVEPGVYIPGVGGVRIEDDVVVTATGVESLTTLPRELAYWGGS